MQSPSMKNPMPELDLRLRWRVSSETFSGGLKKLHFGDRRHMGVRKYHRPSNLGHRSFICRRQTSMGESLSLSLSLPLSLFQVKAEMEARVCGSSKSRRLTCGPSHFWPIPQQVLPARSATLGAYQMLAQSRPAASLTGPGPRSKFHFDIPNCTFCVSILRQRKRIHSRLPTVSFPHLHDPTISG